MGVTSGLTLPVKWGEDGNAFSMQATYAVNASSYLGTVADLSTLSSIIGVPVDDEGLEHRRLLSPCLLAIIGRRMR